MSPPETELWPTDSGVEDSGTGPSGRLVALLLNPPAGGRGARSRNAVALAARALGYEQFVIANLCSTATASVVELNALRRDHGWARTRDELERTIQGAAALLGAWGVAGMTGDARRARDEQVAWLQVAAAKSGIEDIWMVGGEPRHPSRWHQYVSDKYGRTAGGTFEERLQRVLVAQPFRAEVLNDSVV